MKLNFNDVKKPSEVILSDFWFYIFGFYEGEVRGRENPWGGPEERERPEILL